MSVAGRYRPMTKAERIAMERALDKFPSGYFVVRDIVERAKGMCKEGRVLAWEAAEDIQKAIDNAKGPRKVLAVTMNNETVNIDASHVTVVVAMKEICKVSIVDKE